MKTIIVALGKNNSKISYSARKQAKDLRYLYSRERYCLNKQRVLSHSVHGQTANTANLSGPPLRIPSSTTATPTAYYVFFISYGNLSHLRIAFIWNLYNIVTNCWSFSNFRVVLIVPFSSKETTRFHNERSMIL